MYTFSQRLYIAIGTNYDVSVPNFIFNSMHIMRPDADLFNVSNITEINTKNEQTCVVCIFTHRISSISLNNTLCFTLRYLNLTEFPMLCCFFIPQSNEINVILRNQFPKVIDNTNSQGSTMMAAVRYSCLTLMSRVIQQLMPRHLSAMWQTRMSATLGAWISGQAETKIDITVANRISKIDTYYRHNVIIHSHDQLFVYI